MGDESGKTKNLTAKILGVALGVIVCLVGVIYADMRSEFVELREDLKSMDVKVDFIKEKVGIRDAIDEYVIRDIEDLKVRVKKLEER